MSTSKRRFVFAAASLVILTVGTRLPLLQQRRALDDEAVYAVVAQSILDGGQPYVDAVERKPPLLFYVYAAELKAFGRFNWRALHALEVGWILATMAGLYVIGRQLFDPAAGLIAALLYCVFQAWSYWNNLAFNGEVLMNLPIVWAYAIGFSRVASRVRVLLVGAGVLLAVAFLLKQPAAAAAVPLGGYLSLARHRRGRQYTPHESRLHALCLSVGFVAVLGGVAAWLYRRGLLVEAFYWTITNHDVPHVFWAKAAEHTAAFVVFCLPLTAGAVAAAVNRQVWIGSRAERAALLGLVVASAIGASASGRFFPHYYIALVPPCALLASPLYARIWRDARGCGGRWWLARVTQVWLAATVVLFVSAYARGLSREPAQTEAGSYLLEHSSPDDRIFVWGQATRIYLDAQRRPASRFIATFPLTGLIFGPPLDAPGGAAIDTHDRIVPGAWAKLEADFAARPPAYIVDAEVGEAARYPVSQFPALKQLLALEYRKVASTSDGVIYRRIARDMTARAR